MAYTVTVYADAGALSSFLLPGHVFYVLSDGTNTSSYGLYPTSRADLVLNGVFSPVAGRVSTSDFQQDHPDPTASRSYDITQEQFDSLKASSDAMVSNPPLYDLNDHSCVDFVRGMLSGIGIDVEHSIGNPDTPVGVALDITIANVIDRLRQAGDLLSGIVSDSIKQIQNTVSDWYTRAQRWVQRRDPLTFDLDGDGIETVGIDPNSPILFDHDGDGLKTATGWVKADDAFLVLDRNGNGTIDNGTELFGDSTPLSAGGNAADGFAALQDQDTNHDGVVNANDTNFSRLRLWQDLNQDGISEAGELFTLTQKGIAAITVAKTENNTLLPDGNVLADVGSYTKTDGTVGGIGEIGHLGDVDLTSNTFFSQYPSVPLTPEAQALPDLHGSGGVRNLREAASLSGDLASVLTAYANTETRAEQATCYTFALLPLAA